MNRKWMLLILSVVVSLTFAGSAAAHVVVYPREATQGSYEKFTARVPSEKDIPTIKVEIRFAADQVTISRMEPKPGWGYELTKDDSGAISGVTWTAEGEGLGSTEFGEFNMQGRVADEATSIVWKAYQTYTDGSVVEWTGAAGSDSPASVTTVKPSEAGTAAGGHGHEHNAATAPDTDTGTQSSSGTANLSLWISIAALVLALISLIATQRRKSR